MTSDNHTRNRELQQDARAWSAFTGTKYTTALRQMGSPLAQGLLGERVSARHLIAALDNHDLIGARGGNPRLGENGFSSAVPWRFNSETDFIELALITDVLRMFTPIPDSATPEVGSYSLKHTAEWFLSPHCSYVSNGRMIWAAAALGLPVAHPDDSGPNLLIGVPEREHDYVHRMVGPGQTQPNADHYRPAGYTYLQTVLARAAAGEHITGGWVQPVPVAASAPFHAWLILQAGRDDVIGDLASDYSAGVRDSDHRIARTPDDLLTIFHEVPHSPEAYDAVVSTIAEWMRTMPSAAPVRTERIGGGAHNHGGWGAGAGTVERYEYLCPCGDGEIIEEHDNVPGFQEHDVRIDCAKCSAEWRFAGGRPVRDWRLEPVAVSATI
ncbi:hypothetical protein BDK92_6224 [Micromonospora pisi]|uniref:Uncharacterized protein n=1 Tax=Micromonospora pisi TaxID=589240 RepID=A0A495JS49_9ACTN|nr:hypothetical protein [Micromonospora pisi]RKR91807.1 hypothetical protein BDK92_6224 [Micromonospora pisi]